MRLHNVIADGRRLGGAPCLVLLVGAALGFVLGWYFLMQPPTPGGTRAAAEEAAATPGLFATLPGSTPALGSGRSGPVAGALAPDFTLDTLDGTHVTLSELRGRPVLINFWASWCTPCRIEMPDLVRAYEAYKDQGFLILGIDLTYQDSIPDVRAFVKEFKMTFPVLLDTSGEVSQGYRLLGLPLSVFVDREGIIRRIHIGAMTKDQIEQFVGEILP